METENSSQRNGYANVSNNIEHLSLSFLEIITTRKSFLIWAAILENKN